MLSIFDWVVLVNAAFWLGIALFVFIKRLFSEEDLFSGSFWEIPTGFWLANRIVRWLKMGEWWSKYPVLGVAFVLGYYIGVSFLQGTETEAFAVIYWTYGIPIFLVLLLILLLIDYIR